MDIHLNSSRLHCSDLAVDESTGSIISTMTNSTDLSTIRKSSSIRVSNHSTFEREFTIDKLQFASLHELFGREKEVDQLKELFNLSTEETKQLVLIGGGAGTGKSVLALETKGCVRQKGGFLYRWKVRNATE
jgi:transcriptional regulator with PAS, ATPase and Fis domain